MTRVALWVPFSVMISVAVICWPLLGTQRLVAVAIFRISGHHYHPSAVQTWHRVVKAAVKVFRPMYHCRERGRLMQALANQANRHQHRQRWVIQLDRTRVKSEHRSQ
jgi:hypothetical protein